MAVVVTVETNRTCIKQAAGKRWEWGVTVFAWASQAFYTPKRIPGEGVSQLPRSQKGLSAVLRSSREHVRQKKCCAPLPLAIASLTHADKQDCWKTKTSWQGLDDRKQMRKLVSNKLKVPLTTAAYALLPCLVAWLFYCLLAEH
eukprot:1537722-Rhodomonas_salina.3